MEIFSMFIQFNFELTLFEKEGGIARSAMTGDLRETNSNSEFVSINPPSDCFAISHLLFQRRFGSKTLFEKEGGIARSAMPGDLRETNSNSEFVSINPPSAFFSLP